ncbi:RNA polymerase sigma factor [Photobacterium aquae]|uniref:RNA polymerase sigma factor SigZ n=1 Tax=Photobacterium aquae TaxID=1195763 RepID=A0A0J1H161_9GAMM|nr:RNA polymerase sigma factor SigZ [Photobacterium aquae]KLV05563.1 RNA polymerase sigma factor [Photobacterium aquae]
MLSEWQNHKAQLRSYINKRLDDTDAVDDILQEVYIKASTNLHQLKARGSLRGWLYRIAHNAIMDFYRERQPYEALPEYIAEEELTTSERARQEMAEALRPLIEELPEKYRLPLQMAELEGMSQQTIADTLGLSLSGAKSRIQRGRVKLREQFMECCDIETSKSGVLDCTPKQPGCTSSHCKYG